VSILRRPLVRALLIALAAAVAIALLKWVQLHPAFFASSWSSLIYFAYWVALALVSALVILLAGRGHPERRSAALMCLVLWLPFLVSMVLAWLESLFMDLPHFVRLTIEVFYAGRLTLLLLAVVVIVLGFVLLSFITTVRDIAPFLLAVFGIPLAVIDWEWMFLYHLLYRDLVAGLPIPYFGTLLLALPLFLVLWPTLHLVRRSREYVGPEGRDESGW
jgi:hypothetical protein